MKKIFIALLLLGLCAILTLGGVVFYRAEKIKVQMQDALNETLQDYNNKLREHHAKLEFSPFICGGFLSIECKSSEIVLLEKGEEILKATNNIVGLKDFDFKSITLYSSSALDYVRSGDLRGYFEVLMPKELNFSSKLILDSSNTILGKTNLALQSKNLSYVVEIDSHLISKKLQDFGILNYIKVGETLDDPIYLDHMKLELKSMDLSRALYEVAKEQYGKLSFSDYKALVALMTGLSARQFGTTKEVRELFRGIKQLVIGQQGELKISISPKKEFCITCSWDRSFEEIINEFVWSIEAKE
ncbi:hypothetical protein [Helicobacter kayseriensis]|uniref:hypothetical protein n=1 Tax=Helicobacter kayseriensis TaxID=2905877 RepID=UPI001E517E01|nr:hypothetical protein [Helicobacter kayseriensis]MCE3046869.1 hypothetical protein [Helicobacter kayseriensis]MCE3048471.1 hypothetical protein [Helicobacter kayseriensis]